MSQAAEAPLADCSIWIKHHVPTCLLVDTNCEHIVATGKFSNSHFSVTRSEIVIEMRSLSALVLRVIHTCYSYVSFRLQLELSNF